MFSFHEGPDNFFHFTPYGFEILFKDWSKIKNVSELSFETVIMQILCYWTFPCLFFDYSQGYSYPGDRSYALC